MSRSLAPRLLPLRLGSLTAVLVLHALIIGGLYLQPPLQRRLVAAAPLYVEFLAAPAAAIPLPAAPPPSTVVSAPSRPAPPVIATPVEAARPTDGLAALEAPPAPAAEAASTASPATASSPTASEAVTATGAAASAAADAPTEPPRYDLAYLSNPKPAYPSRSIDLAEEGTVVLEAQIGADGQVRSLRVKTSSGFPRLDRAALDAVRRWKFQPSRRGDTPVEGTAIIPMPFKLEKASP